MTIEFKCSGCSAPLKLPDEMGGSRAQCVQCGTIFTIPSATEHFWPPGAKHAPTARDAAPDHTLEAVRTSKRMPVPSRPSQPADGPPTLAGAPLANPLTGTIHFSVSDTVVIARAEASPAAESPAAQHRAPVAGQRPTVAARRQAASAPGAPVAEHAATAAPHATATTERRSTAARPVPIEDRGGDDEDDDEFDGALEVKSKLKRQHRRPEEPRTAVEVGDVLRRAWGIYKANFGSLFVASIVLFLLGGVGVSAIAVALQTMRAPRLLLMLVPQALMIWLMLGTMSFVMKTARGRRAGIGELFGQMPLFGAGLAIWAVCFGPPLLVAGLSILAGASAPMVEFLLALYCWPASWMFWTPALLGLVDGHVPPQRVPVDTLRYVGRNWLPLAGLAAVAVCVLVASCIPLGLGLPLAVPFVLLISTVAYLRDGRART
jgi:hypothetical protein